jgi:hypothetical protein
MVRFFSTVVFVITCLFIPSLAATVTFADTFAPPKGEVVLTVTGSITVANSSDGLALDLAQFEALPQHSFTTSTTWTEGKSTFQGVLLKDLIAAVGATGSSVNMTALDDYVISMPTADVKDDGPMLAYLIDGKPMSVRDKGPIWLLYPYDENADYRTEESYSRSIWQLVRVEFVK